MHKILINKQQKRKQIKKNVRKSKMHRQSVDFRFIKEVAKSILSSALTRLKGVVTFTVMYVVTRSSF